MLRARDPYRAAGAVLSALGAADDGFAEEGRAEGLPAVEGYAVERRLGAGGSGETFLAHELATGARVALKVFHRPGGDDAARQRVERELRVLEQLHLPCVPRLRGSGVAGSRLCIATDYVEGRRLDEAFPAPGGALTAAELRERVGALARIADAVQAIHERGLIHRDLKPSNIIIDRNGDPVIIDLGIATLAARDVLETMTAEGAPIGTPAFMAPEQARGEWNAVSTRMDVYALGAIGYWLCTGETPHDLEGATLHEAIRRVGSEEPRGARTIQRQLPKPLAAVWAKACAATRGDRYASATELASDLTRWLDGEPVLAARPGWWRRMVRLAGRHAIATTAAACCALVGLTLVTTYLVIQVGFREPHLISIGEDSRTASLMSQLGTPLHIWRSTREGGINDAKLFEAGESMRPRMRIATSILLPADLDPELHGQLCIWAADDPSRLLWRTSAVGDLAAPREAVRSLATSGDLLKLKQEVYGAGYFTIAEVFDQSAGKEIITTHHLQIDPTAIRIYSAGGEVLFEAWHWGAAHQPLWLAEEGLIVLAACNNEHRLTEHGIENPNLGWPRIIFAIRPELGARWEYVNPNLARPGEAAEWYRCLLPLDAANELATNLSPQIHLAAAGEAPIRLHYFVRPRATPDASLHFEIDAHGIVLNSFPSDAWRQTRHPLRNVELHLGDLPAPPGPGG